MGNIMMQRRNTGVTLIELMVVVVIVAILAAIAYPSYRQYAIRANRTEAKTAMLQIAQGLEKCYTRFHAYNDGACAVATAAATATTTAAGNYSVVGAMTADTYLLKATPQGGQADDTKCGTLSLDQTGRRWERIDQDLVPANKCW